MNRTIHKEDGDVKSRRNTVALTEAGSRLEIRFTESNRTHVNGGSDVEPRRNSLAVDPCGTSVCLQHKTLKKSNWRPTMQTEIEVLENRDNPMIVWY
jgi:hypothetical protein